MCTFKQENPKWLDSRIVSPFFLWMFIFGWAFVLFFAYIIDEYSIFTFVFSVLISSFLLCLLFVMVNGDTLAMILNAKRHPVILLKSDNSFVLKRGIDERFIPNKVLKEIRVLYVNKKPYSISIDFHSYEGLDEKFIEEAKFYKKNSGADLSLAFPYIGDERKFEEFLSLFNEFKITYQDKLDVPVGMRLPSKTYFICGFIMNMLVISVAILSLFFEGAIGVRR